MEFRTNSGAWGTMFGVPCVVADNFLKLATAQQIKVLIYLLRWPGRSISSEEIAVNTGVSVAEADEAVLFWKQVNVLSSSDSFSAPPIMMPLSPPEPEIQIADKKDKVVNKEAEEKTSVRVRQTIQPVEIAQILRQSPEISELFKMAEVTLGTLNHTMQNSLIYMHEELGLKIEVIVTLITYCRSIEKANTHYIEKIALSWSELDINTLELASEEIQRLTERHSYKGMVMRVLEMKRSPTTKQMEFIDSWQKMGIGEELIKLAYERTIDKIDRFSFDYMNKILITWNNSGVKTAADVKKNDDERRNMNSKPYKPQRNTGSYDDDFDVEKYKIFINDFEE